MKIIHTADWHLGQTFYGFDRKNEHRVFLDWLSTTIKERSTDLLLVAGDLFDSSNPSAEAQKMYYHFLRKVTEENPQLQIIVTAGNHDSAARIEAPAPLLESFNVFVSGIVHYREGEIDYETLIVPLKNGGCCLAVPYLRHNDYPSAESYSKGVAMLYRELCRRANEKGYSPIIAMGHLQASGAEVSVGDSSECAIIGGIEGIDGGFLGEGIAYTALGHLHKAQRVARHENVRYSGAPLPMSFAERKNSQSVTEVTIDEGRNVTVEKIEFDTPVKLLTRPSSPQPLESVLAELALLPCGESNEYSPFLEVRVLVTTVDPTMRQQIEETLAGKNVRLARIEATAEGGNGNEEECTPMTFDDFKKAAPLEIMKDIYARISQGGMPEELESMLNEVIEEAEK